MDGGTAHDEQLFVVPFAKSAVTSAHTPVRRSFLYVFEKTLTC